MKNTKYIYLLFFLLILILIVLYLLQSANNQNQEYFNENITQDLKYKLNTVPNMIPNTGSNTGSNTRPRLKPIHTKMIISGVPLKPGNNNINYKPINSKMYLNIKNKPEIKPEIKPKIKPENVQELIPEIIPENTPESIPKFIPESIPELDQNDDDGSDEYHDDIENTAPQVDGEYEFLEYKCNAKDTEKQKTIAYNKFLSDLKKNNKININNNSKCNLSIDKKFSHGKFQLKPFGLDYSSNFIRNILYDPSVYYRDVYNPARLYMDVKDYDPHLVAANMPDYSNTTKITDIGKINLQELKGKLPAPANYTFKNSPAFIK